MRKLLLALPLFFMMGCAQQEKAAEPTNGFGPYDGQSVYLGEGIFTFTPVWSYITKPIFTIK